LTQEQQQSDRTNLQTNRFNSFIENDQIVHESDIATVLGTVGD